MAAKDEHEAARIRLNQLAAEIARLRYRFDISVAAYIWEEAIELGPKIAALEAEHEKLAASLPAAEPAAPEPVIPTLARPRGMRRPRR